MPKAKENAWKKHDYEIKFVDSPESFVVENCKMIQEAHCFKFICFNNAHEYVKTLWFPYCQIHQVAKYEK